MKDFANAGDYGNQVELVIHAKVKKGLNCSIYWEQS